VWLDLHAAEFWSLALWGLLGFRGCSIDRLRRSLVGWCAGMISVVSCYSLSNFFRCQLAVLVIMQHIGYGVRIRGHRLYTSFLPERTCISVAE
jgi:hypothetical protein